MKATREPFNKPSGATVGIGVSVGIVTVTEVGLGGRVLVVGTMTVILLGCVCVGDAGADVGMWIIAVACPPGSVTDGEGGMSTTGVHADRSKT